MMHFFLHAYTSSGQLITGQSLSSWILELFTQVALVVKNLCQCRRQKRYRFAPWVWKILWRKKWQPTPAFLPRKSHRQRNLAGYNPWGHKEVDRTECTHSPKEGTSTVGGKFKPWYWKHQHLKIKAADILQLISKLDPFQGSTLVPEAPLPLMFSITIYLLFPSHAFSKEIKTLSLP